MIRVIQRRLIIPRGDTGTFTVPALSPGQAGSVGVFTIFDPITKTRIFQKQVELQENVFNIEFSHGDTVNLQAGDYLWDIKFYKNPIFADNKVIDGEEIDSYYAAFQTPKCEIRETGDAFMSIEGAHADIEDINLILAATQSANESKEAAADSATSASESAASAADSATAAETSAQAALDSQTAALASQQAAQASASNAADSESAASASASAANASATNADASANDAAQSADDATASAQAAQQAQSAAESARSSAAAQASNALASASAAANSASAALASQQAAAASASAALTSEQNAAASETNAANSATAAAASAVLAQQTAQAIHEEIPTQVSQLENDAGYLTEHQNISGKANIADLAAVATSGSYNDLSNKPFIPSAISDLTDDSGHYTKPANGIPATDMTSGVQTSLGLADTAYQKPNNGIPASDLASGVIPSVPVQDVQIKNTSILNNGVANIPLAANGAVGLVQGNNTYGTAITAAGDIMIYRADDSAIKNGNGEYKPIVPYTEHQAVFYGLAKAAGDTTQRESQNNVGIYTSSAKSAIQAMLDVPSTSSVASSIASAVGNVHSFDVEVVQSLPTQNIKEHTIYFVPKTGETNDVYDEYVYINGNWEMVGNTQVDLSNYVQKTDYASTSQAGVVKVNSGYGIIANPHTGEITVNPASSSNIKNGTEVYKPLTPVHQHEASFYGLAKAAGDTTQSKSDNAVGTYTTEAKAAIRSMIGAAASADVTVQDVQINGSSILSNGIANIPYASNSTAGVVKVPSDGGIVLLAGQYLSISSATNEQIKTGASVGKPLIPNQSYLSTFYGLAKAAGDTTQSQSDNAVGTYTNEAKTAILNMFGLQLATDTEIQNIINGGAGA